LVITGREGGATGREFCDYLLETMKDPFLKKRWQALAQQ
jgi:hypothetical protein